MIPLLGIGAGISAIGQIGKLGLGIAQMIRSSRMKPQRPTYDIPQEIYDQLALRQSTLNARMPGAQQAEANIARSAQSGLYNIAQGGGGAASFLANASMAQANSNRAFQDLAVQEAADRYNRIGGLENAQGIMAGYRDQAFEYNKNQPYQDAVATKSALMQGGLTNAYNATQDLGNFAGQAFSAQQMGLFGSRRPGTPQPQQNTLADFFKVLPKANMFMYGY